MKKQIIWFAAFSTAVVISACSNSAQTLPDPVNTPEVEMQMSGEIPESPTRQLVIETPTTPPATATVLPAEETTQLKPELENVNPEDPSSWTFPASNPDPNNPEFTMHTLSDEQLRMALRPISEFYYNMYHSDRLLTPDEASKIIDINSEAWKDPKTGFQASYDSYSQVGYYPRFEFPIDDSTHYTQWQIKGIETSDGQFYVVVTFRFEEQGFFVYEQETGNIVTSTPFWGPRLLTFHTQYQDGSWKIIFRHDEDLGTKITPTKEP
jgi:hypothetical protein